LDIQADALPERWDLVFSSLVLEHLPDDVAALEHMRVMCGRHLVLTTIAGDFDRYRAVDEGFGHVRNYRRGELEGKVNAAGFTMRRAIYWGFPFYAPVGRRLQNRFPPQARFNPTTRAAAHALYVLYHLNLRRWGDLLVIHATT
jgi:hypothetical protein